MIALDNNAIKTADEIILNGSIRRVDRWNWSTNLGQIPPYGNYFNLLGILKKFKKFENPSRKISGCSHFIHTV